jgi:spore maturation protein CgeB
MAQLRAFRKLGPSEHINQTKIVAEHGIKKFQTIARKYVQDFRPDLVMFQAHGAGNITPETVMELRSEFPGTYFVNFDGDMHNPLRKFHFEIAKACHLQLLISSDLYPAYISHGAHNVSWWSTATEDAFIEAGANRPVLAGIDGPDVVSLMNRTPPEVFPNAQRRIDSVLRLMSSGINFKIYGVGWAKHGVKSSGVTYNDDAASAELYRRSRMALCISQSRELAGYSSNRLFFAGAVGCTPLLDEFKGMQRMGFIDGKTVIAFRTMNQMLEKAAYYIQHPEECEAIGKRCRELVLERHTYEPRIMALLAYLDGLGVP